MGVQRVAATPSVMKWARESMHLAPEAVSKKLKVELADVLSWESGEQAPPVTKLRELATLYKRPVAVFFLSSPPSDFQTIRDYRHSSGLTGFEVTPKLAYEIRCAHERREILICPGVLLLEGHSQPGPKSLGDLVRFFVQSAT